MDIRYCGLGTSPGRMVIWVGRSAKQGDRQQYSLTGDLALLAKAVLSLRAPIGIFLDRMEECPFEMEGSVEFVGEVLAYLRSEHPNGL